VALLEVRDVVVKFGGVTALDGITLDAEVGKVTGVIGPNGAGKTTLFNVISGVQQARAGTVTYHGSDLRGRGPTSRSRAGMARTFQRIEVFGSLTVRENIMVGLEAYAPAPWRGGAGWVRDECEYLLETVGIADHADQRADAVPTGVARLVEVARALATNPGLLLLDEPCSGLVESETARFGELVCTLAGQDRAIVLVEHDMSVVMSCCDHVYVLDFGQVIASGTPEEIRTDPKVTQAYLGTLDVAS
jgi:branched-chain amino acid transport system ATP-binding protein